MSESVGEPNRPLGVLLVEDDPGDVLIAQRGPRRRPVVHGAERRQRRRRGDRIPAAPGEYQEAARPDLILLDLNLPRMSGHEVLAEVKADPRLRRIPVVVLTTSQAVEDIVRSYDLQASVYVTKPVDFDAFTTVVRQIDDFYGNVAELPSE